MKKLIKNSWKLIFGLMLLGSQSLILGQQSFGPQDYFLPLEEYKYWKNRIKEIHLQAYKKIEACEKDGLPCLFKNPEGKVWIQDPVEQSKGHPLFMIPAYLKDKSNDEIKPFLEYYSRKDYIRPIDGGEKSHVLKIIRHIAPELYTALMNVDPTSSGIVRHYGRGTNAAVGRSVNDGLPIFYISADFTKLPIGQQYFAIAHELGHYALHHLKETESYTVVHPGLTGVLSKQAYKKSSGRLPFEQTFKYAFNRNQENEADRFAILQFAGLINIDDGIAFLKKAEKDEADWIKKQQEIPGLQVGLRIKKAFELDHPRIQERINHLNNELRRELELVLRRPRKSIDWKQLIESKRK